MTPDRRFEIFPAIDLRSGRVVRLKQGDDSRKTVYGDDPRATLEEFAEAGTRWVHVVDLDAALGHGHQRPLVETVAAAAEELGVSLQLGGGLRDREACRWAFEAGCRRVVVSSILARDFDLFLELVEEYPDGMVPALDFRSGKLGIAGWTETSDLGFEELVERLRGLSCPAALVTDIVRDGQMMGPNQVLAAAVAQGTGIPALISGGVRSLEDLRLACRVPGLGGAVVGRALYEGAFSLRQALNLCSEEAA